MAKRGITYGMGKRRAAPQLVTCGSGSGGQALGTLSTCLDAQSQSLLQLPLTDKKKREREREVSYVPTENTNHRKINMHLCNDIQVAWPKRWFRLLDQMSSSTAKMRILAYITEQVGRPAHRLVAKQNL